MIARPTPSGPRPPDHRARVAAMFGRIARRYDLMNTLMTGGLDATWRKLAVRVARPPRNGRALDVGTGTAQLALALARAMPGGQVIGVDVAEGMLRQLAPSSAPALAPASAAAYGSTAAHETAPVVAPDTRDARNVRARVHLALADAQALPFPNDQFDCATTAFMIRNVADVGRAFAEIKRVVKPGGRVVCLELTQVPPSLWAPLFGLYFGRAVPLIGKLVAGDAAAYTYLPQSVAAFLRPEGVAAEMTRAGFEGVRWKRLGFGTVTLHIGTA